MRISNQINIITDAIPALMSIKQLINIQVDWTMMRQTGYLMLDLSGAQLKNLV
jgi:hypothetical protein